MTQGKNPRTFKKLKGQKQRKAHPFTKKVWYQVLAPSIFNNREAGLTPVTKSQGLKKEEDGLKGRVISISLADLNKDSQEHNWRKIKLQIEDVKGEEAYTNFYGMDITRDKVCTVVKKWQSTIEAFVDVKTQDGYFIRIFTIGFTQKRKTQMRATCYATSGQKKQIRGKMMEIMIQEASKSTLKQLAQKFLEKVIEKRVGKECNKIFPLQNIYVTRVKMIKKPKFDITRLMEMYSEKQEAPKVAQPAEELKNEFEN